MVIGITLASEATSVSACLASRPCRPSGRRRRAFTLIELLVVITVISILMGMLLPTLRVVRRVARASQCVNNVRQLAHVVQLYLEEHRDVCMPWIPRDYCQPPNGPHGGWWGSIHFLVQEYMREDTGVWECPADDTNDCTPWDGQPHNSGDAYDKARVRCGYLYNNGGGSYVHRYDEGISRRYLSPGYTAYGKHADEIDKPSKKIATFCWSAHNFWSGAGPGRERMQWWHSDPPELRCPIGYLDGHAENVVIVPGQPETPQYQW